jgi:hypothetical protein
MKNILVIMSLTCLFLSCSTGPTANVIRPLETSSGEFTARVVSSVLLAPNGEVLLDVPAGIEFYRDRFYTQDIYGKRICIFGSDGRLIRIISKGKGPGELAMSAGFGFGPDELLVTDGPWIKSFTLDGNYQTMRKLPPKCWAYEINRLPNGNYLTYGMSLDFTQEVLGDYFTNPFYYYQVIDSALTHPVLKMAPLTGDYGGLEREKAYSFFDGHYLLSDAISNQLRVFDGEKVVTSYQVDFGKFSFIADDLKKDKFGYLAMIGEGSRCGFIDNISENAGFISFRFERKGPENVRRTQVVWSKKSGKTGDLSEIYKASGLPETEMVNADGKVFITMLLPSNFTVEELGELNERGIIPSGVTPDSNPVLLFVKIDER